LHSNQFDTTWQPNYLVLTSGQIGINGNQDAWLLTGFTGTAEKRLRQSVTPTGNVAFSVYAKKGTNDFVWLRGVTGALNRRTFFNLSNGTIGSDDSVSSSMIDMGNGWYRCEAVFNQDAGFEFYIGLTDSNGSAVTSSTGNIYIQYAQLEAGSYATSYIPTSGSAVTRVADNPFQREDLASKNLIGSTEFTWFYDCILFIKEGGTTVAPKLINSSNNQIFVGVNIPQTGSNDLRIRHKDGTNASNTSSIPFTSGDRYKIAVKISGTTGSAYINGTNLGTFTTAAAVNYDKYSNAANNPNNIIDMRIYNTALTDAELIALTTI
jgi:hypothetical protein